MAFEILGIDIMLDSDWNVYVLEVNSAPSFKTDSPLDDQVKARVIGDTLGILWKCG